MHRIYAKALINHTKLETNQISEDEKFKKLNAEKQKMIDSIAGQLESYAEKLRDKEREVNSNRNTIESLQNVINGHQESVSAKTQLILNLEQQIYELQSNNAQIKLENERSLAHNTSLSDNLAELNSKFSTEMSQKQQQYNDNKVLAERLKSNEALITKLKEDMNRAVSDVESAKSQEMELRKYISELEDKIKEGFAFHHLVTGRKDVGDEICLRQIYQLSSPTYSIF